MREGCQSSRCDKERGCCAAAVKLASAAAAISRFPKDSQHTKNRFPSSPTPRTMYQNRHQTHSPSLLISSPPKYNESHSRLAIHQHHDDDVSSLGQVVKKFNGLIDSSSFLQSDKVATVGSQQQQLPASSPTATKTRSDPIDIPKAGSQRLPHSPHEDDDFREGELPALMCPFP